MSRVLLIVRDVIYEDRIQDYPKLLNCLLTKEKLKGFMLYTAETCKLVCVVLRISYDMYIKKFFNAYTSALRKHLNSLNVYTNVHVFLFY